MRIEDLSKEELLDLLKAAQAKKKYGLVWEHEKTREHFDFDSRRVLPVLKEKPDWRIETSPNEVQHVLINSDNFYALQILRYTHARAIDFIYIDPPYNTGNKDFKYNDVFVDREDTFRHSKWLSFMSKRLSIAKELLSDRGVVFASIGDDEQANLKLLMDDIFGESNFVATVPRLTKKGSNKGTFYAPSKDFILVYKHTNRTEQFNDRISDEYASKFKGTDNRGDFATAGLYQASLDPRPNQRYWIECPDGSFVIPPGNVFPTEIRDGAHVKPETSADRVWRWSYSSYLKQKDLLVFIKSKRSPMIDQNGQSSNWNVYTKYYLDDREDDGIRPRDWLDGYLNTGGAAEISKYGLSFSYPKPSGLVKYLLELAHTDDDITVLDFFAGSGTTGDAVLQLNREDAGRRKFILVTNNEENICDEVTYPRLKKAIEGFTDGKGKSYPGLGGNLSYFTTEFVERSQNSDEMKARMADHCLDVLCFKEEVVNELENVKSEFFRIFSNGLKHVAIYTSFDYGHLPSLLKAMNALKGEKKAYIFSFDNTGLNPRDFESWEDIKVTSMPHKMIELLGEIHVD